MPTRSVLREAILHPIRSIVAAARSLSHAPVFPVLLVVLTTAAATAQAQSTSSSPVHLWSWSLAGTSNEQAYAAAVDGVGNVYITGSYLGYVLEFGASQGGQDVFVAKYDTNGEFLWANRYGSFGDEIGYGIDVDNAGNTVITGSFGGLFSFGGPLLSSVGGTDVFVAGFNSAGTHIWSTSFGGTNADVPYGVSVDAGGNPVVVGEFLGTTTVNGNNLVSAGGTDAILVKYNSAGAYQWSQRFGSTGTDSGRAVAVDVAGNVFATGFFDGTVNFGGSNLVSAGGFDIFIAKYNGAGTHQWSVRHGGTSVDLGTGIALDGSGNVLLSGQFLGTANLGGANVVSAGGWDGFVAKYDGSGVHQWSQRFGGTGDDFGRSIVADTPGNVVMAGYSSSTSVIFGGNTLVGSPVTFDVLLARFNATGVHQWSARYGGSQDDVAYGVAMDVSGNPVLTGYHTGVVSFGGTPIPVLGGREIVTAKYSADPRGPGVQSIIDIPNDQGREVKVQIARSYYDRAASTTPILQYEVYRRNIAPPPTLVAAGAEAPASLTTRQQLLTAGWQYVASAPAHGETVYNVGAPTRGDSTIALGMYRSSFFVRATTANPLVYYDSPVDSGYSVDNLAPPAPSNFVYNAGDLNWRASNAEDFDYFTVYGSASQVFDNSAAMIDRTTGIDFDVTASPFVFYYVTATDFSGNEGRAARVNTLSGAGGGPPPPAGLSLSAYPNPFNPRTTIRYEVPSAGRVVLTVYDASGARVATLVDGDVSAGTRSVVWDGRNHRGEPVSSGIYLVEVRSGAQAKTRKIALVK